MNSFALSIFFTILFLVNSFGPFSRPIYVNSNSSKSQGSGTMGNPYTLLSQAFEEIESGEENTIVLFPSPVNYVIDTDYIFNNNTQITFEIYTTQQYSPGQFLQSASQCSELPVIEFSNAVTLGAAILTFEGIAFWGNPATSYFFLTIEAMSAYFFDNCYTMNFSDPNAGQIKVLFESDLGTYTTNNITLSNVYYTIYNTTDADLYMMSIESDSYETVFQYNMTVVNVYINAPSTFAPKVLNIYSGAQNVQIYNVNSNQLPMIGVYCLSLIMQNVNLAAASGLVNTFYELEAIQINYYSFVSFNNIYITGYNLSNVSTVFTVVKKDPEYLNLALSPNVNPNMLAIQNISISNFNYINNNFSGDFPFDAFYLDIEDANFAGYFTLSQVSTSENVIDTSLGGSGCIFTFLSLYLFQISDIDFLDNKNLALISSSSSRAYENKLVFMANIYFNNSHWDSLSSTVIDIEAYTNPADYGEISTTISNITVTNCKLGGDLIHLINAVYSPSPINYFLRARALITNSSFSQNEIKDSNVFTVNGFTLDFFNISIFMEDFTFSGLLYSQNFESPIQIQNVSLDNAALANSILFYKDIDPGVLLNLMQDSENLNIGIPFSIFMTNCSFTNLNMSASEIIETSGMPVFLLTNTSFLNIAMNSSTLIYNHDLFSSVSQVSFPTSLLSTYSLYTTAINNPYLTLAMSLSLNISSLYQLGIEFSSDLFIYRVYGVTMNGINANLSNFYSSSNVDLNISGISIDSIDFFNFTLNNLADSFIALIQSSKFRLWNSNITEATGTGCFLTVSDVEYQFVKTVNIFNNTGISFMNSIVSVNQKAELKNVNVNNSNMTLTFIQISVVQNIGFIRILNSSFNNIYITTNPIAYQPINFILLETQSSIVTSGTPSSEITNCNFTNIVLFKNHHLIKEYINSLIVALLSQDLMQLENTTFYNISVLYDSNTLFLVSQTIVLNNLNISQTNNYDMMGSVYILSKFLNVTNSYFTNNYVPNGVGGALYLDYDSIINSQIVVILMNSIFRNNTATDGAAIYYSQRTIDFTAVNNTFYAEQPTKYLGSVITMSNATYANFLMVNNTFYYPKTLAVPTRFLYFISSEVVSENVILTFNDTTIIFGDAFVGQVFGTTGKQPQVNYNFYSINLTDLNPYSTNNHTFNMIYAESGSVNIYDTVISQLRTLTLSLVVTECTGENIHIRVENCSFYNLTLNQQFIVLNDSTYSPLGIVRLSGDGSSTTCEQSITMRDSSVSYLNYNASLFSNALLKAKVAVVPAASAIMVDYTGDFIADISSTQFNNIFSYRGSAVSIINPQIVNYTTLYVSNSNLSNLISYYEGGAIYSLQNTTSIYKSNFYQVYSLKRNGPAFYCFDAINSTQILYQSYNTFNITQGYAAYTFKTSFAIGTSPKSMVPFFSPAKGSGIKVKSENGSFYLYNITSSALSDLNISIHLVDSLGQLVYDDYFIGIFSKSFVLSTQGKFVDTRACDYYGCIMIEPFMPLKGLAHEIINFTLSYKSLQEFSVPDLQFYGVYRECMKGELNLTQTGECYPCPIGSFSFNPSDIKCNKCPDHVVCAGGDYMELNPGYWRENTSSSLIFACNITGACLGGYNSSCLNGYDGPLCSSCNADLRWVSNNQECSMCPNPGVSLIYTVLTTLVTMAYQVWFVKTVRTSNKMFGNQNMKPEEKKQIDMKVSQGIYIRLLTTYMQIFSLISTFNINFSSLIQGLSTGTEIVANPTSTVFYSSLCSVLDAGADPTYLLYYKVAFTILLTPFKILIVCFYRLFFWRFKITPNRISVLIITAVCIFMLDQPNVFKELVSFIACVQLDPYSANTYINEDLEYSCDSAQYKEFLQYMVLPAMLIYGVIIPLFFLYKIVTHRKDLDNTRLRLGYGALYNEYTEQAYFWGIVVIFLKLVLMYMGSILYSDVKTKALSVFIILMTYYVLYVRMQPYKKEELFNAEQLALASYLVSIFGSIYYIDNSLVYMQWVTAIVVVALNLYTLYVIVKGMVLINLIKIGDILKPILAKMMLKKEKEKKVQELRAMNVSDLVEMSLMETKRNLVTETSDI